MLDFLAVSRILFLARVFPLAGMLVERVLDMPYYALGPWQFDGEIYGPPTGSLGHIDLSPPQPVPTLLFVATAGRLNPALYDTLGSGDLRELPATGHMQQVFEALCGHLPHGTTLLDLLVDCLTYGADVTGQARCFPLMPTARGVLEVHLGGHGRVHVRRFRYGADPYTPTVRAARRRDVRVMHAAVDQGAMSLATLRRVLGGFIHTSRLDMADWREFVDENIQGDIGHAERPATVYTDPFTRADSDALGSPWVETSGDWNIVTNAAQIAGTSALQHARYDVDLSSADHYVQARLLNHLNVTNARRAVTAREQAGAATYYVADVFRTSSTQNTWRSQRRVSGSLAAIGTNTTNVTFVANERVRLVCNGSTISRWRDTGAGFVQQDSTTDTNISGNLRTSIDGDGAGVGLRLDDFEAGDLAVSHAGSLVGGRRLKSNIGGAITA